MSEDNKSKNAPWFIDLPQHPITSTCRGLLERYAKIPAKDVESHILAVRDEVWEHYPYPSIGLFAWLDLGLCGDDLPSHDYIGPADAAKSTIVTSYQTIVTKLKAGGKFLDVGCMFAQDSRKLVADGVPPDNVFCTDLRAGYFECGRKLFRDEAIMPDDHFIAADILDSKAPGLKALEGKLDVINATHVIHVFSIEEQLQLLVRFITLLKPEPRVMCTGRLSGHDASGYHNLKNAKSTTKTGGDIWEHNEESFMKLWREAGEQTGSEWRVFVRLWKFGLNTGFGSNKPSDWHREPGSGIVTFVAERVS